MSSRRRRIAAELRAPLRLVFGRPEPAEPATPSPLIHPTPKVDFVAYAEDCTLSGRIELVEDRLSDLLNAHESFELVDVLVTPLDGAPAIELRDLLIARDELFLVHASGPRGDAGRRQRTRQHPIALGAKPYEVFGYIHALPGSDPVESFRRRRPMVAMTDGVVRFTAGGVLHERRAATLIINREVVDWIAEAADEEIPALELPVESGGPLVKDFTGSLLGG